MFCTYIFMFNRTELNSTGTVIAAIVRFGNKYGGFTRVHNSPVGSRSVKVSRAFVMLQHPSACCTLHQEWPESVTRWVSKWMLVKKLSSTVYLQKVNYRINDKISRLRTSGNTWEVWCLGRAQRNQVFTPTLLQIFHNNIYNSGRIPAFTLFSRLSSYSLRLPKT